jgi:hypothetical protein
MDISNPPIKKAIKVFLMLGVFEGVICLIWLFIIPSDPKTAWLMGYSRSRLFLVGCALTGFAAFSGLFYKSWHDSSWTEKVAEYLHGVLQNERFKTFVWTITIVLLFLAITALWIASKDHWTNRVDPGARSTLILIGVYLTRLAPFLFWLILLILQVMIMQSLLGYPVRLGYLVTKIFSVLIFPSLYIVFTSLHEDYYRIITREDYLVEWLTVIFLILTAVLAILHVVMARRRASSYSWFFGLLTIACILFALEEISWGQRIFGMESPDFFLAHSDQPEINIHNVINEQLSVRTKHIASWALFVYGVILPIMMQNQWMRSLVEKYRIVIPEVILIPGFVLASVMTLDRFYTGQDEEVAEFFFSLLLFLVLIFKFWDTYGDVHQRSVREVK